MLADVKVTVDQHDMRRLEKMLRGTSIALPRVLMRGINVTIKSARTKITRELAGRTGMTQKTVRDSMVMNEAKFKRLRATLKIGSRGIPLIRLRARQTKKGVSHVDPKTNTRVLLEHAFIETVKSGNFSGQKHVMRRASAAQSEGQPVAPSGLVWRLVPHIRFGPPLRSAYNDAPAVKSQIQRETGKDLRTNVFKQLRVLLDQQRRRA